MKQLEKDLNQVQLEIEEQAKPKQSDKIVMVNLKEYIKDKFASAAKMTKYEDYQCTFEKAKFEEILQTVAKNG